MTINPEIVQRQIADRPDFDRIAHWIRPDSRVLDLGCGDGLLLCHLKATRNAHGYGVDICDANVLACVHNGVNVIQMDLEDGLSVFDSDSFDYVILSQTLQTMHHSEHIVQEMLRVGRQGIVTFPNFGYWRNRLQVLSGRMPRSENLPYHWYDTPNVHLCTIRDFEDFCESHSIRVIERAVLSGGKSVSALPNILGSLAVYLFEET